MAGSWKFFARPAPAAEVKIESDIPYLDSGRSEKLDIYWPADAFARPLAVVVLIHGGGWRSGDKADAREREIAHFLAAEGFAVFSINYRLKSEAAPSAWPQNFYDCKSALRFIRQEADRFGINPEKIAVMGESAGGHLAMLVGATSENDEMNRGGLYVNQSNAVAAIVTFYADYDLRSRVKPPFQGSDETETQALLTAASPITYFDKLSPPVFISHGTADSTVSVERSRLLAEHLRNLKVACSYWEIANASHGYALQAEAVDLRAPLLEFLKTHLSPKQ